MEGFVLLFIAVPASAQFTSLNSTSKLILQKAVEARRDLKLYQALDMLAGTPTGRPLAALLHDGSARLEIGDSSSVHYSKNVVYFSRDYIRDLEVWQLAVFLAHELEHARQDDLGVIAAEGYGAAESGAFWVQSRVWVELGAQIRHKDLKGNAVNSQDMLAWRGYPWTSIAAITTRSEKPLQLWHPTVKKYWDEIVASEAEWRTRWDHTWDKRASRDAARFVLRQAVNYLGKGEPSVWLPDHIEEKAGGLVVTKVPSAPTTADRILLQSVGLYP